MAHADNEDVELAKFTAWDAFSAASDWLQVYTKIGWLFLIGIVLVILKLVGIIDPTSPWIEVLWPLMLVLIALIITSVIFRSMYDHKIIVLEEDENKFKQIAMNSRIWRKSGIKRVILKIDFKKQKKSR